MKYFLKKIIKTIIFVLFIFILAIFQITFINHYHFLGVKLNLVLIGLLINVFSSNFITVILGAITGGLIYDFSGLFNFMFLSSFLLTIIFFRIVGRKYLMEKHLFLNFFFGFGGTIIFNFFYVLLNYLLFHENFFYYFFSWRHCVEMFLNGIGMFTLGLISVGAIHLKNLIWRK